MKRLNWDRAHLMKTDRRGPRAYLADMRMEAQIERVHISYQSRGAERCDRCMKVRPSEVAK